MNQQLTTTLLDCWSTLTLSAGHARVLKPPESPKTAGGRGFKMSNATQNIDTDILRVIVGSHKKLHWTLPKQSVQNVHHDWESVRRALTLYYKSRVGPI